jgi:thymidylate kinase
MNAMSPQMSLQPNPGHPILISFSGLDGSGKTTQIDALREAMSLLGVRSTLLVFWDDAVFATRWREGFVHKVLGSEQGVGEPGRPVERRDKNVRKGYLTVVRHLLYLADAVRLRLVLRRAVRGANEVIVMDRYLYDELANLPLRNRFSAAYAKLLARIVPRPDLVFLLDVVPELARARKPEYSVNFMCQSRRSYFRLAELLGYMTIIPALELEEARRTILASFLRVLGERRQPESRLADRAPAA